MKIENMKIILASASARRKQLLKEAGYKFKVVPSRVDEAGFPTENIRPVEYAKQLALAKANDVAGKYPDSIVIGADTVVDYEGKIIGKPADAEDAERITRMLFSRPHKVITGIAIVCKSREIKIIVAETTVVYPRRLTDSQIAEHIKSGVWRDKAGAYAIQENNDPFVDHIEGSMTNVMGLPMELLKHFFHTIL
ncbi:MAG: septum formation protein Maf [Sedimentisphaerales bacterium]|nr:septum formation protein Maf [Sedimentisphaerales bacterium]